MIIEVISWLLSKLSPYSLPPKMGVMLSAQGIITERPRSAFDLTTGGRK